MDVKGFTTKIMSNVRFTAPELMPIEETEQDAKPTFASDIFSLGMLLLQVSVSGRLFQVYVLKGCHFFKALSWTRH